MLTDFTKKFGVWKKSRPSFQKSQNFAGLQILFALLFSVLIIWLIFLILLKVQRDFLLINSHPLKLKKVDISNNSPFYFQERHAPITLHISYDNSKNIKVLFNTGELYKWPYDKEKFKSDLMKRSHLIVYYSMVARKTSPSISRVKIYCDEEVPFEHVESIIKKIANYGFDDFDIAVQQRKNHDKK
jgi:biopolymer transport protein ExbD